MSEKTCAIIFVLLASCIFWSAASSTAFADESGSTPSAIPGKGYFRIEIVTTPRPSPEGEKNRILVETFEMKELPSVPDLREYPELVMELKGYMSQGFRYIKVELTTAEGRRSKKIELYREVQGGRHKE